jgi:hypothetical protein
MRTLLTNDYFSYSHGLLIISEIFKSPVIMIFLLVIAGNLLYLWFGLGLFEEYL